MSIRAKITGYISRDGGPTTYFIEGDPPGTQLPFDELHLEEPISGLPPRELIGQFIRIENIKPVLETE